MLKKTLTKRWKFSLKVFLFSLLCLANLQLVMADAAADANAAAAAAKSRAGYATFNVSKYLTDTIESTQSYEKTGTQEQTYLKSSNPVASFILQIINLITLLAASLSFLAVVVGGFFMLSAAGNETQINKGKDIVTRAIIGLVLTLSSYFIVSFVQNLFYETAPK